MYPGSLLHPKDPWSKVDPLWGRWDMGRGPLTKSRAHVTGSSTVGSWALIQGFISPGIINTPI